MSSARTPGNGGSAESYRLVHGKDEFDTVLQNLEFIARYRKEPAPKLRLLASCVVTRFIENEIEPLKERLLRSVDEVMLIGVGPQAGQSASYIGELSSSLSEPHAPTGKTAAACALLWNRVHLTAEGYLSLCCVDYENALTYADLNRTPLAEAWHNATIREMRGRHRVQALSGTLCQSCLYRTTGAIHPISEVGHSDPALPLISDNPRGLRSVASRIEELKRRAAEKEPAEAS